MRPRIAGGAVYYTHKYKLKRGKEDSPKQSDAGYYPALHASKALIALRFLCVVVNSAVKMHVYDSEPEQMPQPAQATRGLH